jgi:hypothetical protein
MELGWKQSTCSVNMPALPALPGQRLNSAVTEDFSFRLVLPVFSIMRDNYILWYLSLAIIFLLV